MEPCKLSRWQQLKSRLNNLEPQKFVDAYLQKSDAACLDVRTQEEYRSGHLPGAVNMDYLSPKLADLLEALPADKCYYVYCRTGRRSLRVCTLMQNMGIRQVYNCDNGIKDLDPAILSHETSTAQSL